MDRDNEERITPTHTMPRWSRWLGVAGLAYTLLVTGVQAGPRATAIPENELRDFCQDVGSQGAQVAFYRDGGAPYELVMGQWKETEAKLSTRKTEANPVLQVAIRLGAEMITRAYTDPQPTGDQLKQTAFAECVRRLRAFEGQASR